MHQENIHLPRFAQLATVCHSFQLRSEGFEHFRQTFRASAPARRAILQQPSITSAKKQNEKMQEVVFEDMQNLALALMGEMSVMAVTIATTAECMKLGQFLATPRIEKGTV